MSAPATDTTTAGLPAGGALATDLPATGRAPTDTLAARSCA